MILSEGITFGVTPDQSSPLEEKRKQVEELNNLKKRTFNFDEEEDTEVKKEIFSVYGLKNDGKTTICYGIPAPNSKILVISFDNKSWRPLDLPYIKAAKLEVKPINGLKYIDKSTADLYQATSDVTYDYILAMIEQSVDKFGPDWIIIDATENLSGIMEQVMRLRNQLRPYQGISNLSVWKERKQYLDDIHNKAKSAAKKGVIYTMYADKDEIIDRDGTVIRKKDIPKWVGSIMQETDVTIRADATFDNRTNKRVYWAIVEGSKLFESYPDGKYDVTGKRFVDVVSLQSLEPQSD